MIEKVNPMHPDKVADRIAGAMVDLAYAKAESEGRRPRIAVEVLAGHGKCHIIAETSEHFTIEEIQPIVDRISKEKNIYVDYQEVPQDPELAKNQEDEIRCGDNGIFKGIPLTSEEITLSQLVRDLYKKYPTDGKYIFADGQIIACQSQAYDEELEADIRAWFKEHCPWYQLDFVFTNPLGPWTGGLMTDSGATNRKLGSDMATSVTGGGIHGKDLSKADVALNICAFLEAQWRQEAILTNCAIGDDSVVVGDTNCTYNYYVERARRYVNGLGGFEKLAEWGLF